MKSRLLVAAWAGLVLAGTLQAGIPRPDLELDVEERLLADSNVLRLSDRDRRELEENPDFQTDVEGVAGLKVEHRLGLQSTWRLGATSGLVARLQEMAGGRSGRGRLRVGYDGKWSQYEQSPAQGYNSHALRAEWLPRAGWGLYLSWRYLDNFYLRQYTDRDTDRIRGATFDSELSRVEFRFRMEDWGPLSRPSFRLHLLKDLTYYNAWFTEYDTETLGLGARLDVDLPLGIDLDLSYAFMDTDNVGFDDVAVGGSVLPGTDDEGGDGSHQEDQYRLGLFWELDLPLVETLGLGGSVLLRDRWYSSGLGELEDPFHYGRHDRRLNVDVRATVSLPLDLRAQLIMEREMRWTTAAHGDIDKVKNYNLTRIGVGLRWSTDLL